MISDLADEVRVLFMRQQVDIGTMQFGFMPGEQAGREVHLYYGERQMYKPAKRHSRGVFRQRINRPVF